jgi:hypothetical protein
MYVYSQILDSSVGTAMGYRMEGRGSIPGRGTRFFSASHRQDRLWGYPASYPLSTEASSQEVKRPGREADHSPLSSAEVKKDGTTPPIPITSLWRSA